MSGIYSDVETEFVVRYAETDQMGIVHHSNYPVWFEAGRTKFFKQLGFPYSLIEGQSILLPLTDIGCRFKKPAHYEDNIIVKTRISKLTHVRIGFYYEAFEKESNALLAEGETNHGWTDRGLKPVIISKIMPDLYETLVKNYSRISK